MFFYGMGMVVMPAIFQLVKLCVIGVLFSVQGSTGYTISPSPAISSEISPVEETNGPVHYRGPLNSNAPISEFKSNGSGVHPPLALPPLHPVPISQRIPGLEPTHSSSSPTPPPHNTAPPPLIFQGHVPFLSPDLPSNAAPPPLIFQGHVPFLSPDLPSNAAPPPLATGGHVPPMPPKSPQIKASPSNATKNTASPPLIFPGHMPSLPPPNFPIVSPPSNVAPPPLITEEHAPRMPLKPPEGNAPTSKTPVSVPVAPAPTAMPSTNLPPNSPLIHPSAPGTSPPIHSSAPETSPPIHPSAPETSPIHPSAPETSPIHPSAPEISPPIAHQGNVPFNVPAIPKQISPVSPPPGELGKKQPVAKHIAPEIVPSMSPAQLPQNSSAAHPDMPGESPSALPGPAVSHASTPTQREMVGKPVAAPPDKTPKPLPPVSHSPTKAPSTHNATGHFEDAPPPSQSPPKSHPNKGSHSPASSPSVSFHNQNHERNETKSPSPASPHLISPPSTIKQGPLISPSSLPANRQTHHAPPPLSPGSSASASHHPYHKPVNNMPPIPSPSPTAASGWSKMPVHPPKTFPSPRSPKLPPPPPIHAFPPPPPNEDCSGILCTDPYTNTPSGAPCSCVLPMQVGLSLNVALYTFFPLVSELAQEIAAGVFMKQSQVRIMGANAASQAPERTIVLIDLVPLGERFDNTTALLTSQRFWQKQVVIKDSLFGDYEVLYVHYPGLPPSPPLPPSSIIIVEGGPYAGNDNNARSTKPLGVDVQRRQQKNGLGGGIIAIIALSATVAIVLISAVVWILLFRHQDGDDQPATTLQPLPPSVAKPSGTTSMVGSGLSSASLSFGSSIAYTGSAKTFSTSDIERATNNFDDSRILGEGGFGRVYSGTLEDETKVAVKVLKRDDLQGSREFLAEVEMLSRLHHRNLVKLIGICTEDRARCLVYELIPNGSVESHLHGADKESAPLDWDARIKIALGAARGLAYLHEDSSPRVIHRDFKSSNILLEHDFTPKVSDFGLARTAMDEENRHISTRVMGTFGYVAPEYAMTGHLLVKSDVYSYGVVLLELLTGRKPVDMLQPPGQENLVAWARPLLTSKEGLESIIDPSLGLDVRFDSVAKVAAIASMCVQPEVSHRPFMGEVVQALKLVCNECDEAKEVGSRSSSQDFSADVDAGASAGSGPLPAPFQVQSLHNYDTVIDIERGLSMSDLFSSVRNETQPSGSSRRYSTSGPLRMGRGRKLWQRMRRLTGESVSEHGTLFRLWPGSH